MSIHPIARKTKAEPTHHLPGKKHHSTPSGSATHAADRFTKELTDAIVDRDGAKVQSIFAHLKKHQFDAHSLTYTVLTNMQHRYRHVTELLHALQALDSIAYERHKLHPLEMLAIAVKVQKLFQTNTKGLRYVHRSDEHLARSLIVNFEKKNVTILSKKYGILQAHGAFKKVTDAVQIIFGKDESVQAKNMARAVNYYDKALPEKELEFEKLYGNIDTIISYSSKYDPFITKTSIIQELYDSDLYLFTAYTDTNERKTLTHSELMKILETVGNLIEQMHRDGVVHRDIKTKNVLFRQNVDSTISVKVCDFGHTERPPNTLLYDYKRKKHGTIRYSPPEILQKGNTPFNPFEQQKAVDMYGIGCLLYELLLVEKTPWSHDVYVAFKRSDNDLKAKALQMQKEAHRDLQNLRNSVNDPIRKALLDIAIFLLEPDPKRRMTILEFQSAIKEIKNSYLMS